MRLCIVGSSHVGCLKTAWDRIRHEYPAVQATFFAHKARGILGLVADGRTLVPSDDSLRRALIHTSRGLDRVVLDDYDLVLLKGTMKLWDSNKTFFSRQVLRAAIEAQLSGSDAQQLIRTIRAASPIAIYFSHTPLLAMKKDGPGNPGPDYYLDVLAQYSGIGFGVPDVHFVAQPSSTIVNKFHTQKAFSQGSLRLAVSDATSGKEHRAEDRRHMNTAFGEATWRAFFGDLGINPG